MYEKLFTPVEIRGLELKNRIILPAMGTKFANKDRTVSQQLIDYHVERAKNGTALNIVEVCSVHPLSSPRKFLAIGEDKYIPGLKSLTDAIHEAGGKAGLQLWQGSLAVSMDQAAMILVASDMPISPQMTLPGISKEQISEIVGCYGAAARRATEAGFDCVEVHVAHNYLPHSFLSPGINHRTDEYGGSFENRARFPLEIIRAVRENIPEDMPVLMRIDAHDDYLEGGLTIEDVVAFCKLAKEAGVDVLDISRGNIITAGLKFEVPPIDLEKGFNIENASRIRKETGMLTIGVGRINTPDLAEDILEKDKVDMVVIGRGQLADPEFVKKAAEGRPEEIVRCIGCNQGCYDGFENPLSPHITCMRNPALGRETACRITKAEKPETVLIAGGGIGGLEAAITLKQRGHSPILCEASDKLGGQFLLAGEAPRKAEMKEAVIHMGEMAVKMGVDVRMNTKVTPELIEEIKPHTFINAIGAVPAIPNIPGKDLPFVVDSHDVLSGAAGCTGNVVVIGGGMVGMETAEYLAQKGCKVTDLEMMHEFCQDMGSTRKICVTENVYAAGITPVTDVTVTEISEGKVVAKKDGERVEYPCDYAVMAVGARSRDGSELEEACRKNGIAYFAIGDAAAARRAINATREAFDVALHFDDQEMHEDACKRPKVVFVTGGTGTMGKETILKLLSRSPRFKVKALARPSEKNRKKMREIAHPDLEVIWGDMNDYDTILRCVTGSDYVLHIGAMVSPAADMYPEETLKTNIGSTLKIIKAIKAQPNPDDIHLAYVATVAMTGSRLDPIHWGRCGDPINPSIHDYYGISKVFSEMAVFESGLKHWVSIRQTGQFPCNEATVGQPIIFHQPVNNVLEWCASQESGSCMANLCEDWVDESFWRKAYNLSSGKDFRLTCWEFQDIMYEPLGFKFEEAMDSRDMALFNFHGQWYTDADKLDEYLHFRFVDGKKYWKESQEDTKALKANPMIGPMMPDAKKMRADNEAVAHKEMGPKWMFETDQEDWIRAFFGSRENHDAIKSFEEGFEMYRPSEEPSYLNHGYDENKPEAELDLEDMKKAAAFRGGECLSETMVKGDLTTPLRWKCGLGHEFEMSPNAVLKGGHWCPECLKDEWHYGEIAKVNPFYAQVWTPTHGDKDDYHIPMKFSAYKIYHELKEELGL